MPTFRYTGRNHDGSAVQGEMVANSPGEVIGQMSNRRVVLINLEEIEEKGMGNKASFFDPPPSIDEMILFSRQMQTLISSGVPIGRAFSGVRDGTSNRMMREVLTTIMANVEAGTELSQAMSEFPKIFNRLYRNMIRIGEQSGQLDNSFGQLFAYMETDQDTRNRIKSALRYPSFVLLSMFSALFTITYFVIPTFFTFFEKFKLELPWQTKLLMTISEFTVNYWYLVLGGIVALVGGFIWYIRSPEGEMWWDEFKFSLPVVGSIILRGTLARFARTFSMGSRSGVPLLQSLDSIADAVDNVYVGKKIKEMSVAIQGGDTLMQAAYVTRLFPPLVMQMMSVGEETGNMDRMMDDIAKFYERELEYDVKKLTSLIEPIITIMLGGMVLILAVGVFMPMWSLVQLSSQH
ncbi:MAG: type II secretion system F family protein [Magnetococcales bacterium]|nr:type II secretion system F family protein [Magnetococcales bacterium]MBF0438428.1 type II secretion system F family protein [Magnetococcales bacterium]